MKKNILNCFSQSRDVTKAFYFVLQMDKVTFQSPIQSNQLNELIPLEASRIEQVYLASQIQNL